MAAPAPLPPVRLEDVAGAAAELKRGVAQRIVGLEDVIDQVLITLLTGSHALLEGVPGLAKTLLLSSLAELLDLKFNRIQFTPDLMPSDVTGSEYLVQDPATGQREFRFAPGPVFAHVVLADEINRAPPKTQAALMEAMEERQVTSLGLSRKLDDPFFVLATQNPIEQEGTYPLPEAQLDRFMFLVKVDYPSLEEEVRIVEMTTKPMKDEVNQVLSAAEILEVQEVVRRVPISEHIVRYVLRLVRATRVGTPEAPARSGTRAGPSPGPAPGTRCPSRPTASGRA